MAEELEVLALGFARDALDKQDAVLAELRARTGTLLAASSIVASFLGATAIGRDGLSLWSVAALIALAASLALCVVILLPRSDLSFSLDGPRVYEELYEFRGNPLEVHHRLAYDLRRRHEDNQDRRATVRHVQTRMRIVGMRTCVVGAGAGGNLMAMAAKPNTAAAPPPPPPTPGIFIPEKRGDATKK